MNLLSNALKFTHHGFILVRTFIKNQKNGNCFIQIEVEDSGIGISQQDLNTLFDEFTQVDNSMTKVSGGTGLGLAISKKLAELMQGELTVKSIQNEGSVFTCNYSGRFFG